MNAEIICPLSSESLNKSAARVGATLTALLLTAFGVLALVGQYWSVIFLALVMLDYVIRVFTAVTPPISRIATGLAGLLRLRPRLMNKGPKIFAWRIGFLMATAAVLALPFSWSASAIIALALAGFNVLDGVLNFCVGCYVYTYLVLPLSQRRGWVKGAGASPTTPRASAEPGTVQR
ncbi:MAG: DUF4395 family protein [Actinobacteria bacterium]|nr:DUF4395 family protein [Actinomycetota bacterium]